MTHLTYHHLIWDFDGTICDTAPAITQAYVDALADYGVAVAPETVTDHIHGTLTRYAIRLAKRHDFDVAALMERYWEHLHRARVQELMLFPGVLDVLQRVQKAGGQQYLFTHHRRASLMRLVDHHRLGDFFTEIITSEQFPRKPDPTGVRYLLDTYTIPPKAALMIGDREPDIQAGQAAGIRACLFGSDQLDGVRPEYHITTYDQLAAILFPDSRSNGDDST